MQVRVRDKDDAARRRRRLAAACTAASPQQLKLFDDDATRDYRGGSDGINGQAML